MDPCAFGPLQKSPVVCFALALAEKSCCRFLHLFLELAEKSCCRFLHLFLELAEKSCCRFYISFSHLQRSHVVGSLSLSLSLLQRSPGLRHSCVLAVTEFQKP